MRACLITESDFYYREVDFGVGMKARLRVLNKFENLETAAKLIKMKADEKEDNYLDYLETTYKIVLKSLTDISGKTFDEGGAGWNFENVKGEKIPITLENIKLLNEDIFDKLQNEYLELRKTIEENKEIALKN